jgi:ribosomal protein S18 acetylase RimI-like enzyme
MIRYSDSVEGVTLGQLHGGFFEGWPNPPSPETHLKILKDSDHIVLAIDEETGQVVGFVTAISDGILSAYIPLLEVLPAYRRRGIGTELMRRMMGRLRDLYMIDLITGPELEHFYRRFGMGAAFGMIVRNFARQSGV